MKPSAVQNRIGQHLVGLGKSVVFPNKSGPIPAKPYLVMQNRSRTDVDGALAGGKGYSEGSQAVVVVGELNAFATAADDLAYAVKERFPKALRLGGVTIRGASVQGGYTTETDYRVPVIIDWIAT
ncbi:hypothetical protein [Paracoccus sp. SY]|uniref:hypothetical protein n=1 Tax=Paracoccus sp. SY TaxID=1330255 RepID=UPI001304EC02|nr:hypothetical protein [Paracoccus sp. SY]